MGGLASRVEKLSEVLESPEQAEKILTEIWEELSEKKGSIAENKAHEYLEHVYDHLSKTRKFDDDKKDTVSLWFSIFDEDNDGRLSWEEFKQSATLFEPNYFLAGAAPKDTKTLGVVIVSKILLKDISEPVRLSIHYKHQTKETPLGKVETCLMNTDGMEFNKDSEYKVQVWHPHYVFFVEEQQKSLASSNFVKQFKDKFQFSIESEANLINSISSVSGSTTRKIKKEEASDEESVSTSGPSLFSSLSSMSSFEGSLSSFDSDQLRASWDISVDELLTRLGEAGSCGIERPILSEFKNTIGTYRIEFQKEKWEGAPLGTQHVPGIDREMDMHSKLIWSALHPSLLDQKIRANARRAKGPTQLPKPRAHDERFQTLSVFAGMPFELIVPTDDDTVKNADYLTQHFVKLLGYLPLTDFRKPWASRQEAIETLAALSGDVMPAPLDGVWAERTSDSAVSRMFFQGIAAGLVYGTPSGYEVNLDFMKKYAVRPGFMPFQGIGRFDHQMQLQTIELNGQTYTSKDPEWEFSKLVLRSSGFTVGTFSEHALQTHFIWSNSIVTAARVGLPINHPIRRLVNPHVFHAANANEFGVYLLLNDRGMFHRGSAFTHGGIAQMAQEYLSSYKFSTFRERLEQKQLTKLQSPFVEDGFAIYSLIQDFVSRYVLNYYGEQLLLGESENPELVIFWSHVNRLIPNGVPELSFDSLINVLTEFIFQVSAYHTLTGDVVNYVTDPACVDTKLSKGRMLATRQTTFQTMIVAATTGADIPKFLDHCFDDQYMDDEAKKLFSEFQEKLNLLSNQIDEKNKQRVPFNSFNPRLVMLSTGI